MKKSFFIGILIGVAFFAMAGKASAADRYWVGNDGNWTDTAHWSTTSGGAGGASVPTYMGLFEGLWVAKDGIHLTAVINGGLYTSTNEGTDWIYRLPTTGYDYPSVSKDGSFIIAKSTDDNLFYKSVDYGETWDIITLPVGSGIQDVPLISMDDDGSNIIITGGSFPGNVYISDDYGDTWNEVLAGVESSGYWGQSASDSDGSVIAVNWDYSKLYVSTDYGATWEMKISDNFYNISMDSNGSHMVLADSGYNYGNILSKDFGETWETIASGGYEQVLLNSDGSIILRRSTPQYSPQVSILYMSDDDGLTWTNVTPPGEERQSWAFIGMDDDGSKFFAASKEVARAGDGGGSYPIGAFSTSSDSGTNWSALSIYKDNVIFDQNSFSIANQWVTVTAGSISGNIDTTNLDKSMYLYLANSLVIYGDVEFTNNVVMYGLASITSYNTENLFIEANTQSYTGSSYGGVPGIMIYGGTTNLLSDLDLYCNLSVNSTNFNTNDFNITAPSIYFSRSVSLGSSILTSQNINLSPWPDGTVDYGTSTIFVEDTGRGYFYNLELHVLDNAEINDLNVILDGSEMVFDTETATCENLTITGSGLVGAQYYDPGFPSTLTINNLLTITGNSPAEFILFNNKEGKPVDISADSVNLENVYFQSTHAAGSAINWSGISLGDLGGNENIIFTPAVRYPIY